MKKRPAAADEKRLVLGIETATRYGSVAAAGPEGVIGEIALHNPRSHSEKLMPAVDALLKMLDLAPASLSALAVSTGPGSFTGLRIGVSSAKGLSFALGIPLYGVSTLETLAANCPPGERAVAALLDARRGEIVFAIFRNDRGKPVKVRKEALARPRDLPELLPPGAILVGDVPDSLREQVRRSRKRRFDLAPRHLNHPRAAVVASRGLQMLLAGQPSETGTLLPFYFRPLDAKTKIKTPPQGSNSPYIPKF